MTKALWRRRVVGLVGSVAVVLLLLRLLRPPPPGLSPPPPSEAAAVNHGHSHGHTDTGLDSGVSACGDVVLLGVSFVPRDLLRLAVIAQHYLAVDNSRDGSSNSDDDQPHVFTTWMGRDPAAHWHHTTATGSIGNGTRSPPPPECSAWPQSPPRKAAAMQTSTSARRSVKDVADWLLSQLMRCRAGRSKAEVHRRHHRCVVSEWAFDVADDALAIRALVEQQLQQFHGDDRAAVSVVYARPVEAAHAVDQLLVWLMHCRRLRTTLFGRTTDNVFALAHQHDANDAWWTDHAQPLYDTALNRIHQLDESLTAADTAVVLPVGFLSSPAPNDRAALDSIWRRLLNSATATTTTSPLPTNLATAHWANLALIWHMPHGIFPHLKFMGLARTRAPNRLYDFPATRTPGPLDQVTFITFNSNSSLRGRSLAEQYWSYWDLPHTIVLGQDRPARDFKSWLFKVTLMQSLFVPSRRVTTPYIVVTDGFDVFLAGNITALVDRFESFEGVDVLLCNTHVEWPPAPDIAPIETKAAFPGWFHKYGSAGALMARTDALLPFIEEILRAAEGHEPWTSSARPPQYKFDDQLAWRRLMGKHFPRIRVDSRALIFSRFDERLDDW